MAGAKSLEVRSPYRKIRGRPSKIDQLPDECEEDIVWANRELAGRQMTQTDILAEFNRRIGEKGHLPISKGCFSRHSVEQATVRREVTSDLGLLDLAHEMFPDLKNDTAALAREILKLRMVVTSLAPDFDPKTLNSLGINAKRASEIKIAEDEEERRKNKAELEAKREAEEKAAKIAAQASELVEAIAEPAAERAAQLATEAGLSAERVQAIRRGVLGLTA